MKKLILLLPLLLFLLSLPFFSPPSSAAAWYYPLDKFPERITVKHFGQFIDKNFYLGKENLFPNNRFYGYHAGVDLEVFPDEENKDVPIFAVTSGTINFVGYVSGYGGLILENFGDQTALYGHLKLSSITLKTGDQVTAGQKIALLGNAFSLETDGERKHLHFGIYKGSGLYFKGYETSFVQLQNKWENPEKYLAEKGTVSPIGPTIAPTPSVSFPNKSPFSFFEFLKRLVEKIEGFLW